MDIWPLPLAVSTQVRRFLTTGVINTAVHTCVAVALIKIAQTGPTIANVVAFITATWASYLLNTLWSFSRKLSGETLARFITVSVVGACVAGVVAGTCDILGAHYLVGIACVAIAVAPTSFLLHKYWTYRS